MIGQGNECVVKKSVLRDKFLVRTIILEDPVGNRFNIFTLSDVVFYIITETRGILCGY